MLVGEPNEELLYKPATAARLYRIEDGIPVLLVGEATRGQRRRALPSSWRRATPASRQ